MLRKLAPSILSADFLALGNSVSLVQNAHMLHVDVMDGHFVPNLSVGLPVVSALRGATDMLLDVHLMITHPSRYLDAFLNAGADILNLHIETETPALLHDALRRIRQAGRHPALTLKPQTPVPSILPFIHEIDMVLLMTVEPGFGGQTLIPETKAKIPAMRALLDAHNPGCDLQVDGGVTLENAGELVRLGANVLVAGSAVFDADDVSLRVQEFLRAIGNP